MKHILFTTILTCFIAYLPTAQAAKLLSCSHPELCRLGQMILNENNLKDYTFTTLVKIVGDPHEYEPSVTEVKNLISADVLIVGPVELNPWIKKVNYQRSKNPALKTVNIPMDKSDYAFYPDATHEAVSHFWLYPNVYCSLKNKMEEKFVEMKMIPVLSKTKSCLTEARKVEADLRSTLNTVKLPIVLTHDALLPLLESFSSSVVAIKGSGHHQEASPKSVKKLYDALKAPKVIWVEEMGINVPQNILSKKRSTDLTIKIDTANSTGPAHFQVLNELNEKIKALKP